MADQDRFPTLKDEARHNVERIDPLGKDINAQTMRLFVQPGLDLLAKEGERDERCGTCAGRPGTVPAGCIQTQADFLKAVSEDVPFMCHAHETNGKFDRVCHAWFAARWLMQGKTIPAPWPWSAAAEKDALERHGAKGAQP